MKVILLHLSGSFSIHKLLQQLFDIDANTSATIIITVLIFFLGYILNSLAKSFTEYLTRKRGRKVFLANLSQLEKSLKNREEILTEQLHYLETVPNKVYAGGVHFYSIEVLREIGFKSAFESFLSGWENIVPCGKGYSLKRKAFNKVWSIVSIVEYWDKSSKEDVQSFQKAMNEMNDKKMPSSNQLRLLIDEYLASTTVQTQSPHEIEFKNQLKGTISNWRNYSKNINDITEFNLKKHYLEPIKNVTAHFKGVKVAKNIYDQANDVFYWNNNMEIIKEAFEQQLKALRWYMRYCRRTCRKIIKVLD